MKSPLIRIEEAVSRAVCEVLTCDEGELDPQVRPAGDRQFGDYQSNVALAQAKRAGRPPRDLAAAIIERLDLRDVCEPASIAGPGFINFTIKPDYLAAQLEAIQSDARLGIPDAGSSRRVVVDFSSPNLAKEMHIGHLRTTIIGETICRLLEFAGQDVLRLNHVGDWGTQFGMLLEYVREEHPGAVGGVDCFRIDDLEQFYRKAKERFDHDAAFAAQARKAVVALQAGESTSLRLWEAFRRESLRHAAEIYDRLGVTLVDRGESYYNAMLPEVVRELTEAGVAVASEGAVCVFVPGFTGAEGRPQPMIIRKSDGGYNYATTDLAALKQRIDDEKAGRIIYVTDVRQVDHFKMLFGAARLAGWVDDRTQLEHVGYGMILGKDRRPFKTRSGETVRLSDVLDEAEDRALQAIAADPERRGGLSDDEREEIAAKVGIGAVIYSDLSHNPASDYVFDWDVMLAMEGNTAPYLMYAYARIRNIGRKAGIDWDQLPPDLELRLEHESEIGLAKQLLLFGPIVEKVTRELRPNDLTEYLYSLARAFSTFYDRQNGVRVIDAEPEEVRLSRLRLCDLTARTLRLGLWFLCIEVVEQM